MDYKNKRVLVCGMAKSGVSAALLLKKLGAAVTIQDLKEKENFEEQAALLEGNGIELYFGKNPDDIIKNFDLVIVSPGIPCDLPFFNKAFGALVPVWGEIELGYSVCQNPVIAITGTNGKTTTTALTGEIMQQFRPGSETVGNIGIPFTEKVDKMPEGAYIIAEISSFQLETAFTFRPKISAVLNITPDHLNRHKTFEKYIDIKERIFAKQKEDDFIVLNFDDIYCRQMALRTRARVFPFGRKETPKEGIFLKDGDIWLKWNEFDEKLLAAAELNIPGGHNIENAMAAAGIAVCADVPLDVIRQTLKSFKGVEHRIEFVRELNGVEYYNDSKATNTDSAIKAVEALGKPIILIGGGQDKGLEYGDWVRLFADRVKYFVVIGEAADKMMETCKAYGYTSFERANTLKDAVDLCAARAEDGDCVLLSPACASFDMFDNYEQRGRIFKEFVMNL